MTTAMIDLSPAQAADRISKLLAASESRTLDFKRISAKLTRIVETVCAFANTDGGIIAIGIGDAKEVKDLKSSAAQSSRLFGIEENPEAFDDLQREIMKRFEPAMGGLHWVRVPCTLHNGQAGHIVMLRVEKSDKVHSIVGDGTWTRMDASNREMSASETTELSYQRGTRSAESETVPVSLALLETDAWRDFAAARGRLTGTFAEQLQKIGLAHEMGGDVRPTRAAVLLFADEPGSLLAAHDTRADVRVMVFDGKAAVPSATPNYRKPPKTVRGPLIEQIDATVRMVLDEIAQGVTLSSSGFKAKHAYPERVVKEAIVNAVIHRDYRLNRDIFIRIFDDRIEVESPGTFPGNITAENIMRAGSKARNPLVATNLREFPNAPNIDAGEGVKAMFAEMDEAKRYPPQYRQSTEAAVEHITLTLFNLERPTAWDEVSHWIDKNGPIGNSQLREIAKVDVTEASRMLKDWVQQGVLTALPDRGRRNAAYAKPATAQTLNLFANGEKDKSDEA
jgi:ATP-dependent DNA helicase RecG